MLEKLVEDTKMRISMAQTKPVTGDLLGNIREIIRYIQKAKEEKADIIVFPETSITGYCCGALFEQEEFIKYNKRFLTDLVAKEVPENMAAIIGFVDFKGKNRDGSLDLTNSVALIQGGKVLDIYDKIILANGNHHEDKKYFTPGKTVKVFDIAVNGKKVKIGTPICEDAWFQDHERDIIGEMKAKGAELIICPNQSYFYYGKQKLRHWLFSTQAKQKGLPVISVNAVGVGDIVKNIMIYDGGSLAYDAKGNLIAELERFRGDFRTIDVDLVKSTERKVEAKTWDKYDEIYHALKFEQKEIFNVIGIPNAQVHMSGGVDSAVVGSIVYDAMGKDHTVFITNPTEDNGEITRGFAQQIADRLGVKLYWNSTQEPYKSVVEQHKKAFGEDPSLVGKACIQAVLRTVQGIGAYHQFKSGIVATGNHTEIVEGWATFHDIGSIGVHSIIGDLTKTEVFKLAEYINKLHGQEIIPAELYNGKIKPMAELADAKEDPIDYYARSGIDAEIIRNKKSVDMLVDDFIHRRLTTEFFDPYPDGKTVYDHYTVDGFSEQAYAAFQNSKRSVFKSAQAAPTVIVSPRSRGFSSRETIINRYNGYYDMNDIKSGLKNFDEEREEKE
jgi:NAD+ synthase (glutamine-hydrolysing)